MEIKMICDKCNGEKHLGIAIEINPLLRGLTLLQTCTKCNGKGEVDWIEHIVGSYKNIIFDIAIKENHFNSIPIHSHPAILRDIHYPYRVNDITGYVGVIYYNVYDGNNYDHTSTDAVMIL